jgi:sugar phosphate isomerase/epimerase
MKLATSTGDFSFYVNTVAQKVKEFKNSPFKYINLEQTGNIPEFFSENDDDWKRLANDFAEARGFAGIEYVVSHAPCLHNPVINALSNPDDETYRANVRAIRRSIEICHILGINRIVVHACANDSFTKDEFYRYNTMFYREFFDLMEKYNITVMTENWDNNVTHFSTGQELRDFIDHMEHPLLAACWDTAHGNIDRAARSIGQYENIISLGDKLKGLHISDNFGDCHHHSWPFAGRINFDSIMQGLLDVNYDGFFTFEASYTLIHHNNPPYGRSAWSYRGEPVKKLLDPSIELKKKAVELLYETGKYILSTYECFEG